MVQARSGGECRRGFFAAPSHELFAWQDWQTFAQRIVPNVNLMRCSGAAVIFAHDEVYDVQRAGLLLLAALHYNSDATFSGSIQNDSGFA